jgi:hypothetical protein
MALDFSIFEQGSVQEKLGELARQLAANRKSASWGKEQLGLKFPPRDVFLSTWTIAHEAEKWFELLEIARKTETIAAPSRRHIAVFALYPWWITYFIALSVIMRRLGHRVSFFWLPHIDPERRNENWETDLIIDEMAELKLRINDPLISFENLADISGSTLSPDIEELVRQQSHTDTQIHKRTLDIDIENQDHADHIEFRTEMNRTCAERLQTLMSKRSFSSWISHNGSAIEFGILHELVKRKGERIAHIEFGWRATDMMLSLNKGWKEVNYDGAWRFLSDKPLTAEQRKIAIKGAMQHENPTQDDKDWLITFQSGLPENDERIIRNRLKLVSDKPVVLLMGHIDFDTSALDPRVHTIFESSRDWISKTVQYFIDSDTYQLIVRPHPIEAKIKMNARLGDLIENEFGELPSHIKVLPPDTDLNTYSLMRFSDLGLCYQTDAGYEMVMRGKPVICGGRAKYSYYDITYDPQNIEQYFDCLNEYLGNNKILSVSMNRINNSIKFFYLQWERSYKKFPWRVYHLWEHFEHTSMEEMLTTDGMQTYSEVISILSGDFDAYDGVICEMTKE